MAIKLRRKRAAQSNNFEAVMLRNNQLLESFIKTVGTQMEPEEEHPVRQSAGWAGGWKGIRSAIQHRRPVRHKSAPIQYDETQLMMRFGNHNLKQREEYAEIYAQKHGDFTGPVVADADHRPLYELGFFQDCALDPRLWTLIVQPMDSIINMIPVRANNSLNHKFAFITAYNVSDQDAQTEPSGKCDPCLVIQSSFDACRISFPYGRLCRRAEALETNELVRRFCDRQYDDFLFDGDLRGREVFPAHFGLRAQVDRSFIVQGALRRKLFDLGRYFQLYMMPKVWDGDPANNVGSAYKEFYGLANLIRNDYGEVGNTLPLESLDDDTADCSALNSDIKDFGGRCISDGSTPGIWSYLQEMEDTLYRRAQALNVLPVQWGIFMISTHWNDLTKVLPCQMVGDGCVSLAADGQTASVSVNDGGSGMFNLAMRERMLASQTLTINGRSYPVFVDDTMPYTFTPAVGPDPGPAANPEYQSDIWFIPFTAGGEPVLFWEHIDYSELDQELAALPGSVTDLLGWTDDGRFHHAVSQNRWCFEIQSKMEVRLIFLAPHLAGRIQDVVSCPMQTKPFAFNGAGAYAPTLGG